MSALDSKIPEGPLAEKWSKHKFSMKLVNPANKRKYDVIVVGTGLAGASAAASLGELGYNVKAFFFRIAHAERTVLPHRAELTQQKIIRMTVTVCTVFFMIPLKEEIIVHVKEMFTAWRKSA